MNVEILLCCSESVARFGNSGIREMQSGTRDVKLFMSMNRVLTVLNTVETDGGVGA